MDASTSAPILTDPQGAAKILDDLLPARRDGRPRDRRNVYRLLPVLPPGILVRLPGQVFLRGDLLREWILGGGLTSAAVAPKAEDSTR